MPARATYTYRCRNPGPPWARMSPVPSLLLIEDDDAIRTALELSLTRQGHRVATAASGEDGLKLLREQRPDLIVLDVMLPGIDGFEVCRRIRRTDQLPIILLTARSDDIDIVVGLESGADDYVVKPVQGRVLDARIRAVLRRGEREANDAATFGSLVIDRAAMTVTKNGDDLQLTPTELRLLLELSGGPDRPCPGSSCCGWCGSTTTSVTRGWWTRVSSGCAPRSRTSPRPRRSSVPCAASATAWTRLSDRRTRGIRGWRPGRKGVLWRLRFTSLRLRLVVVFGLVALTAAVSASGIAYWLNREAVLTRAQDAVLRDFRQEMQNRAGALPVHPTQDELMRTAGQMANSSQRFSVLLVAEDTNDKTVYGNSGGLNGFSLEDVPKSLRTAVNKQQSVSDGNKEPYHLYWQRVTEHGTPYLVAGTRMIGGGPTGYMLKSLEPEAKDLNSLAWSLGIATGLALIGSALLAQAAATTVLKPVHRLGIAARLYSARASSTPGCGSPGPMNSPSCHGRSTRPPRRWRNGSPTWPPATTPRAASSPTCRTSCAPR